MYLRFAAVIRADPEKLDLDEKVGSWIKPWPGYAPAFVAYVNDYPPYKSDGIRLVLRDISTAVSIGDVGEGIANRYVANGWKIT